MRKPLRYVAYGLAGVAATIVVLALAAALTGTVVFETSVPDYNGRETIAQLDAPVTVLRDAHAVPHIFAETTLDAYRALGFVQAQDRFFQMELMRRIGTGRLSELIGPAGLRSDRFMRTLGIGHLAESAVAAMSPQTRAAFEAYAEGVNAWLRSPRGGRPPELVLLGVEPEPWRAADSALWSRLLALLLSGNWTDELLRAQLAARLNGQQLADLWPGEPKGAPTTLTRADDALRQIDLAAIDRALPHYLLPASASNQWVVDGAHSATGKPLLANDPHLGFTVPGIWYLARIETPTFSGAGATLPGEPLFAIGHNDRLAWGFTSTEADTQDLFIERLDPSDPKRYLTPDGSAPFAVRDETISVRFRSKPEVLHVRTTRHGPVISDVSAGAAEVAPSNHVLALAFPALLPDDRTVDALYGINHARSRAELLTALHLVGAPMENLVYATTGGDIGFVAAARVPIRRNGDGRVPVPGWTGAYDWVGFVPFDKLPQRYNPAAGWIANANNRVAGDGYPYLLTADWPESYRAERIGELLRRRQIHDLDSFEAIQLDTVSPAARELLALLLPRLATPDEPVARAAAALLRTWDGTMARAQPQPLILTAWLLALGHDLYGDELGKLAPRYWGIRPHVIEGMLRDHPQWCDNIATPAHEDCATTLATSFRDAVARLRAKLGDDPTNWHWGDLHVARFEHPALRRLPILRDLFAVTIPTDGGDFTINRGTPHLHGSHPFEHVHGAGLRVIFDLADLDNSRLMTATGQSGDLASPFFADTTTDWRDGRYFTLRGSPAELRRSATGELSLVPR